MTSWFSRLWKRTARRADRPSRLHLQRLEDRAVPAVAFAVGAGEGGGPRVKAFDANLNLVHDFMAYDPSFRGGVTVSTADVTGDGTEDIITGAGNGGGPHVKVFDGVTGGLVREWMAYDENFRGGVFVAGGDITSDGRAEVFTGTGTGGGPHVRGFDVFESTRGGFVLRNFFAYEDSFRGGVRVAAGDVTGDGRVDIVTGPGIGGGADLRVFTGEDNDMRFSQLVYDPNFRLGMFVSTADVTGDGIDEILTGVGNGGATHVRILTGDDGTEVPGFEQGFLAFPDQINTNGVRVTAADLDGDGADEIITGGGPGSSSFRIYNSKDLSTAEADAQAFESALPGGIYVG